MRNLPHYSIHPFSFYKSIVLRRHNPARSLLLTMERHMESEFNEFIKHDLSGTLHKLHQIKLTKSQKELLLSCYAYRKTKDLRESVMLRGIDIKDPICPYCTIDEYKTMDHFLPKENYPAHSVNSSNLIPCCHICNDYKGTLTQENGNRLFLNLYSDILPEQQYLFVTFNFNGGTLPVVKFYLQNINGIDPVLYSIIYSHYEKLHLFERFSDNSINVIKELNFQIRSYLNKLSDSSIKDSVIEQCLEERSYYGFNYWKSILKQACIDDPNIYSLLKQNTF